MGAAYALAPAFEADLFGTRFVAAVHGRMLTASSVAAVGGPEALTCKTMCRAAAAAAAAAAACAACATRDFYVR